MRLLTSQRENLLGVSQEQGKRGDVELRPCLMVALEIEPSPYGCSSRKRWLKSGVSSAWLVLWEMLKLSMGNLK